MAEEQFTSRRARREQAERLAAEQAFEARETPEQPERTVTDQSGRTAEPAARTRSGAGAANDDARANADRIGSGAC